jgi:stage V sporulation protein R
VEAIVDHAHAVCYQRSRNLAIKQLSDTEQRIRAWERAQPAPDPWRDIHPAPEYVAPNLTKTPAEPVENLLQFISQYNPYLPEWKRDILQIVDQQTQYFMPQMETKIMNEGWASYWHHKILNELKLPQDMHLELIVRHNQVLRPHPGGLNPYHLGFVMWHDIERRWNEGDIGKEWSDEKPPVATPSMDENDTPGRRKIFEVRESDRDQSFLRRFLTRELMEELHLFQHDRRGKERVVTKVSNEEGWKDVRDTLIKNVGTGSIPVIKVEDADFGRNRTLYLKHYHDGRDLQLEYADHTLKHVAQLWEREVVLETIINGKGSLLKVVGDSLKIERL